MQIVIIGSPSSCQRRKLKSDGSIILEPELENARHHLLRALEIDDKFARHYKLGLLQVKHKEYSSSLKISRKQ